MVEKQAIVTALGEDALLLPQRVHEAQTANEQVKYYLSLLQQARLQVDMGPGGPALADLSGDRRACGIADESLDRVVATSRLGPAGDYRVPGARSIAERIDHDVAAMIAPVRAAGDQAAAESFAQRLEHLTASAAVTRASGFDGAALSAMMSADRAAGDSLHLLVMDVHKAVIALEARLASDEVDGARAFGLADADRPLVAAFMRGLHATERVRLGHPGLGTTATRDGARLVLENDVGATEAHVLVVHVEDLRATITATDVHPQRLEFLRSMLEACAMTWEATDIRRAPGLGAETAFYHCLGTHTARDAAGLEAFLAFLGSRLVFLIDWNRARKQLRAFASKSDAVALLRRAADEGYGHRGFVEMGGEDLVYDAMTAAMRTPFRFGERLDEILGREPAVDFLQFVLRECAEGLLENRPRELIREQVRAELSNRAQTAAERLLGLAVDHAAIVKDLAAHLADELRALARGDAGDDRAEQGHRAKARERAADEVLVRVRELAGRIPRAATVGRVVERADDAADDVEEAAFLLTLLPPGVPPATEASAAVHRLGEHVVRASEAYLDCLEASRHAHHGAAREELRRFLEAVARTVAAERDADEAQRQALAEVMRAPVDDSRLPLLLSRLVSALESACDALLHAALTLRDERMESAMVSEPR